MSILHAYILISIVNLHKVRVQSVHTLGRLWLIAPHAGLYAPQIPAQVYLFENKKSQNIKLPNASNGILKQSKQLVCHPKSLGPTLGEGYAIRSPPVPPSELECLKEIPPKFEGLSGQLLAYWVVLLLFKVKRMFRAR